MELDGEPVALQDIAALAFVPHGHFTSMRVDGGMVRGLSLHLDRLARDCRSLFDVEFDLDGVRSCLRRTVARIPGPVVVRLTVFDPRLALAHPGMQAAPRLLVTTRPAPPPALPPLNVRTRRYIREEPEIKHVGLFGTIRQKRIAQREGFDDALLVGGDGRVLEGTTWNIGFFDGAKVVWPDGDILDGVTMRLLAESGCESTRTPLHLEDLRSMHAAFASNAAAGVRPIAAIDDIAFSADHPVVGMLRSRYEAIEADAVVARESC